ncbi:hypothetical protein C8Q77DRAFT_1046757 [Trametes polyzona]|nr:hypothetical protein C8Q77DRAFT_1046757 [Trametes polyzona]
MHLHTLTLQSSGTRLARRGSRLVQGLREKSSWFVAHIIKPRPEVPPRADPRIRRRRPRATRPHEPGQAQASVARQEVSIQSARSLAGCSVEQEVCPDTPDGAAEAAALVPSPAASATAAGAGGKTLKSVRKLKRIGGRAVVALNIVEEECESDAEDFGRPYYSIVAEDSSGQSEYYTAISHMTDLSGLASGTVPQLVDESSGAVFVRIAVGSEDRCLPSIGCIAGECYTPMLSPPPTIPYQGGSPNLLTAPTLMLTLPTPQMPQSPVFIPRSPITLSKYVEATTPEKEVNPFSVSSSSASLSPAPSVPACDRCCLAQLEDGVICRACEKQWLACKMWYQAHDGGRRRWLTEPYITPAESTASTRAAMRRLGVPGTHERTNRGLGLGSSSPASEQPRGLLLPFRVLATASTSTAATASASGRSRSSWATRLGLDSVLASGTLGAARRRLSRRKWTADLRALWANSSPLYGSSRAPDGAPVRASGPLARGVHSSGSSADDSSEASAACAADIGGHRRPTSSTGLSSSSSFPVLGGAITSSSRFVEHLFLA